MSRIRTNTLLLSSTVLAALASCTTEIAVTEDTNFRNGDCPLPLELGSEAPFQVTGTVPNAPSELHGSCAGDGPEATFLWTAPADGSYTFDTTGSNYDTVLYLRDTDCSGQDLACNDDTFGLLSEVWAELEAGQVVYIVLDAYAYGGDYVLNIAQN